MNRRTRTLAAAGITFALGVVGTIFVKRAAKAKQATSSTGGGSSTGTGIVPPPPDAIWLKVTAAPPGALDSGQFFADWFNAAGLKGSEQTASERARLIAALIGLGADAQGYVQWRPSSTAQLTALAVSDQFERETTKGAPVVASGLRSFVSAAAVLPENPILTMTGMA